MIYAKRAGAGSRGQSSLIIIILNWIALARAHRGEIKTKSSAFWHNGSAASNTLLRGIFSRDAHCFFSSSGLFFFLLSVLLPFVFCLPDGWAAVAVPSHGGGLRVIPPGGPGDELLLQTLFGNWETRGGELYGAVCVSSWLLFCLPFIWGNRAFGLDLLESEIY